MAFATQSPLPVYVDGRGSLLEGGFLNFGVVGGNPETAPVAIYWDAAATQPAGQPLRTIGGLPVRNGSAAPVYVTGAYSLTIRDALGRLVAYEADSSVFDLGTQTQAAITAAMAAVIADLASATNVAKGAGQTGYGAAIAYATGVGLQLRRAGINLAAWPGVDPTGASDSSAAIRLAMAEATSSGRPLVWNGGTYLVTPDPASPPAGPFLSYCLKPANNAVWVMTSGALIKQANGAQSWCRCVSFQGCDGLRVYGELRVDANAQNRGGAINEHMHGVFLFDTKNSHFDRIHSINAVGDNVFIGGTDENAYGDNITIGSIYAKTAGRKNLVFHHCDNLQIGSAILDNSAGGSLVGGAVDSTERHCLDVEPDTYTGARRFVQSIGRLETYGMGNDFTAGTNPVTGDNWIVNIGSARCVQSAPSATVKAWAQNAITVNIAGTLEIVGCAGADSAVDLLYSARLNGGRLVIKGASATAGGYMLSAGAAGGDENRPELNFGSVMIENTVGHGVRFQSAVASIGTYKAKCAGYALEVGDNVSSASYRGSMTIDHLVTRDTGVPTTGAVVSLVSYAIAGYALTVRKITVLDTRGTKTGAIFQVAASNSTGLTIGDVVNPEAIPLVNWMSTDKFYRLGGSYYTAINTGPAQYVCVGTPDGMISAMIGSTAMRQDGGAGTSFYVKQSLTGNTGWVGK